MERYPNLWHLDDLLISAHETHTGAIIDVNRKIYVPARPLGFASFGSRVRLAWMVFTGKADALLWPYQ